MIARCIPMLLVLGTALAAADHPTPVALGDPVSVRLHVDAARMRYAVELAAGEHLLRLPDEDLLVQRIDGATTWHRDWYIPRIEPEAVPADLAQWLQRFQELAQRGEDLHARRELLGALVADAHQRIPAQMAAGKAQPVADWQQALDAMYAEELAIAEGWQALATERLVFADDLVRAHPEHWALRRYFAAEHHPHPDGDATGKGFGDLFATYPEPGSIDTWLSTPRNEAGFLEARETYQEEAVRQPVVRVALAEAGTVTLVLEDDRAFWDHRARLVVAAGGPRLVRQALVSLPTGFRLGGAPLIIDSGSALVDLDAPGVPALAVSSEGVGTQTGGVATSHRAAPWDAGVLATDEAVARERSRSLTWRKEGLNLVGADDRQQLVELAVEPVQALGDEWLWSPQLGRHPIRRIGIRLGAEPLLPGPVELLVDGAVLGTTRLAFTPAGSVLQLAAGEDQRIFNTASEAWPEDPLRRRDRRVDGTDHVLRNLSDEAITVQVYATYPVSETPDQLTVELAPRIADDGWATVQPGVARRSLTLPAGAAVVVPFGWLLTASGGVEL